MLKHLLIGLTLLILTSFVHLMATHLSLKILQKSKMYLGRRQKLWNLIWLEVIVMIMVFAAFFECMIWAGWYTWTGAIDQFETAIYFSIVTFTTLGYGDITLGADWRILASMEAATGIIVFGWSTAIVFMAIQNIYFEKMNKYKSH